MSTLLLSKTIKAAVFINGYHIFVSLYFAALWAEGQSWFTPTYTPTVCAPKLHHAAAAQYK